MTLFGGGVSMFGWSRSKLECPVDAAMRQWIDGRWQWLEEQFGVERLRTCPVVLPRPEFFPGAYHGSDEDARRMLDQVCEFMGIDPAAVELSLYEDEDRNPI
jgi:predicted nuclease of restriction endonuclease-like RecB superfamily